MGKTDVIFMNKKSKHYEMDMCSGSIVKKMLFFTVPLMCASVLQLLFNAADIVVVGRFAGDNSLAAVGSTGALINLMVNLMIGLSIGGNVLVARYYGAREHKNLEETIHTAMLLSLIGGIVLSIIGCLFSGQIMQMMDAPKEVLPLSVLYLRIYFMGTAATIIYNFGAAILRAVGDTRRPLYYLFLSGVINVILNLILVIGFSMDVAGVALATVVSQWISAILVIRCLIREKGEIHLDFRKLRISKDKMIRIFQIGIPASFQGVLFSLSNVIIQASVNSFGAVVVAGNAAAANIEGFVYVSMNAFQQSAISFTGQNLGAAKYERINRIAIIAELCVIAVGVVTGNGAVLFGQTLLGIYSDSQPVIDAGILRMLVICRFYFLCGMMDVMCGMLRGLGYSVIPMIVSLFGACGLRLLWIFTFFRAEMFHTTTSLYLTYPVTWTVTFLAHLLFFVSVKRKLMHKLKHKQ